jgi:twitching motility protein PilT
MAAPWQDSAAASSLDFSLADLVRSGKATLEIATSFAESPDELEALAAGRPATGSLPPIPTRSEPPGASKRRLSEEAMDLGGLLSKSGSIFGKKGG